MAKETPKVKKKSSQLKRRKSTFMQKWISTEHTTKFSTKANASGLTFKTKDSLFNSLKKCAITKSLFFCSYSENLFRLINPEVHSSQGVDE